MVVWTLLQNIWSLLLVQSPVPTADVVCGIEGLAKLVCGQAIGQSRQSSVIMILKQWSRNRAGKENNYVASQVGKKKSQTVNNVAVH